jgi:hypothetical protein
VFRLARRLPFLKLLAIGEVALLLRRHLLRLEPQDRRRLAELVRHGRHLDPAQREELRTLVGKLDARAFALAATDAFSPLPVPKRFFGKRR